MKKYEVTYEITRTLRLVDTIPANHRIGAQIKTGQYLRTLKEDADQTTPHLKAAFPALREQRVSWEILRIRLPRKKK